MFDKYIAYIVLTKSILDKSLKNKDFYYSVNNLIGDINMKLYEDCGALFDYVMVYKDFKNKEFVNVSSGLYFKFNEIQENRKTELYQLLPDFNHLINNLK